jgi:hypothetical protein
MPRLLELVLGMTEIRRRSDTSAGVLPRHDLEGVHCPTISGAAPRFVVDRELRIESMENVQHAAVGSWISIVFGQTPCFVMNSR